MHRIDNPIKDNFDLKNYLEAQHVWVSKTGMGVGVGINPENTQRLGWVEQALTAIDKKRQICDGTLPCRQLAAAQPAIADSSPTLRDSKN